MSRPYEFVKGTLCLEFDRHEWQGFIESVTNNEFDI